MANNTAIKFYVKSLGASASSTFSSTNAGSIVFDKTSHALFVNGTQYGGNLADATYTSNVLTIIKSDGTSVSLDFSTLATAASVMKAFDDVADELNAIETGAGLNADGTYTAPTGTNYLESATSLKNADTLLDAQIKSLSDAIDEFDSDFIEEVQINGTALTETNNAVNIEVDGTYSSSNKIATQSTVTNAIGALDVPSTGTGAINGMGANKTIATLTETDGKIAATFQDIEIDGNKVTSLNNYDSSNATGNVDATDDLVTALEKIEAKADSAISSAGVTKFGNQTGDITLGSYLTMGTGADNHQVSVTNVDTAGTSSTATDLATVKTVTEHIGALDGVISGTPGAGNTVTAFSETDGVVTATFGAISITSSQISDASANLVTSVKGDGTYLEPSSATKGDVTVSHKTRTENTTTGTAQSIKVTDANQSISLITHTFDGAGHETGKTTTAINFTQITAADLGLSGAMHFKGTESSLPIPTTSDTYENGDVILVGNKEYIRSGKTDSAAGSWVELGDESSYALNTITVTGENGLTGGGALSQNRVISHSSITTPSSGTDTAKSQGDSVTVMTGITGDGYGHVTGYTTNSFTIPTVNDATLTLAGAASGPITVAGSKSGNAATFSANDDTANTITITHSDAPTGLTPSAIKVAVDSYGHVQAGTAIVASEIGFTAPSGMSADDVQEAIEELNTNITSANLTIDGHKGAISTGDGLTDVTADGGSFGVKIDSTNANGLSVGSNGVAMAKATGSTFGTVEVTAGNGLTLTDGVVAYAHNTTAITVASKDTSTNVITINGTLTPDASDAITTSNTITLAAVAATGAAANVSIIDSGNNFTATDVEGALAELAAKTATVVDAVGANSSDEVVIVNGGKTTIATVDGSAISTIVAFYWEEYA